MNDQPRKQRHHYIPQFYLSGFTKTSSNNGKLYVFDKDRQNSWDSSPKNAAYEYDFYAIDGIGTDDRMFVEKELSNLEGNWSSVLRWVIENESIPSDESFDELMMFMAFMYSRIPKIRNITNDFTDKIFRSIDNQMIDTPEQQKQFSQKLEEQGITFSDGKYKLKNDQSFHNGNMFEGARLVAPILSQRNWQIWKAKDDSPDLICSDNPVAPTWLISEQGLLPAMLESPFSLVSMPLNRRIALVGVLDEEVPEIAMEENYIAAVNAMTMMYANQLYSSGDDFVWTMNDGSIGKYEDFKQAIQNAAK